MKTISGVRCVIIPPQALSGLLAGKMNAQFLKLCPCPGAPPASQPAAGTRGSRQENSPCSAILPQAHLRCSGSIFPASLSRTAPQGPSLCWESRVLSRRALLQHIVLTVPSGILEALRRESSAHDFFRLVLALLTVEEPALPCCGLHSLQETPAWGMLWEGGSA